MSFEMVDAVLMESVRRHREAARLVRSVEAGLNALQRELTHFIVDGRDPRHGALKSFAMFQYLDLVSRVFVVDARFFLEFIFIREQEMLSKFLKVPANPWPVLGAVLVMGREVQDWLGEIGRELTRRLDALVARHFSTEEDREGMLLALRGTRLNGFSDSVFSPTQRALESLVRTAFEAFANHSRRMVAESVPGVEYEWQQLSILDNRTSAVCQGYAFKVWDRSYRPVGHKLAFNDGPPRHWGCRSILALVLGGERLEGLTFEKWIEGKSAAELDALFGEGRMKLWRKGYSP